MYVCFIIREVSSELDGEEEHMTKLIKFMIDSDNMKVNSLYTRCIQ